MLAFDGRAGSSRDTLESTDGRVLGGRYGEALESNTGIDPVDTAQDRTRER